VGCIVSASVFYSCIIREHAQLARVPQLINEAVVGMALAREQQPRGNT
jgi:hypothetical protein